MRKGKGVVAAGHELTAKAAAEILQDGGNAFDACVAGLLMTFVAEAVFASPGGGGFLMARREGSDAVTLFDFFAETPRKRRPSSQIDFYPIYADFGPASRSSISAWARAPRRGWCQASSPCMRHSAGCR